MATREELIAQYEAETAALQGDDAAHETHKNMVSTSRIWYCCGCLRNGTVTRNPGDNETDLICPFCGHQKCNGPRLAPTPCTLSPPWCNSADKNQCQHMIQPGYTGGCEQLTADKQV